MNAYLQQEPGTNHGNGTLHIFLGSHKRNVEKQRRYECLATTCHIVIQVVICLKPLACTVTRQFTRMVVSSSLCR